MDSAFIHQAANELVQNAGTRNIKQIARSCSLDIQQKKAGPSAWICTTSYLPNALQSAAKKEELTAASPPDVKIGATNFSKKAKK